MKHATRTRLSPEARKDQLLNTAKLMIVKDGLQNFTMEALSGTAGVSSPLVYNYFSSRLALLETLLQVEYCKYNEELIETASKATNFIGMVRVFIAGNFDHYAPGNILPILLSQPEIVGSIQASQSKYGKLIANLLVLSTKENYKITRAQAKLLMYISSGASKSAAEYSSLGKVSREKTIKTTLTYVLAGLSAFSEK